MNIFIVDYGMGNVHSVSNALTFLGYKSKIISSGNSVCDADILIFPGVGAFGQGMEELRKRGFVDSIKKHVNSGKPFLGLCLGMHLLFDSSTEHGLNEGLGILKGKVIKFSDTKTTGLKVPHMGWNSLNICKEHLIFKDISKNSYVYFVHSYFVIPEDKNIIATTTDYGIDFCSMVIKDNIFAMQFHPEKSQQIGLKLLENFFKEAKKC